MRRSEQDFTSRRSFLKLSALGTATLGLTSVLTNESQADEFPYGLDGFKTFREYKANRKANMLPCDSVVVDPNDPALVRDTRSCLNCGHCDQACMEQSISHWYDRATLKSNVATICTHCGQCVTACKFNVLHERLQFPEVANKIANAAYLAENKKPTPVFVALTAPALRVSLGELFDEKPGVNLQGALPGVLRKIGFDYVFDATFGADLTTVTEAKELRAKLDDPNFRKPLFTSCCPAWVSFVETFYPEFIENLSTTRSPLLAQATALKTKFAQDKGIDPKLLNVVAFVPCIGKKYEASRPENIVASKIAGREGEFPDLDFALTTRELGAWLSYVQLDPKKAETEEFDDAFGAGSGAGKIFGATGGVLSAILRQLWFDVEGTDPPEKLLELKEIREIDGLRETTVKIGSYNLRVAVVCGLANARALLEKYKTEGSLPYDFVEVMACPGGCVGGGGQPKINGRMRPTDETRQARSEGLFQIDASEKIRTSGANPQLSAFLESCENAETLFHTSYQKQDAFK